MSAAPKWEEWIEWRARVAKWGRVLVSREVAHPRRVIVSAEWLDERTLTSTYDVAIVETLRAAKARGLAMVGELREKAVRARGGA